MSWRELAKLIRRVHDAARRSFKEYSEARGHRPAYEPVYARHRPHHPAFRAWGWERVKRHRYFHSCHGHHEFRRFYAKMYGGGRGRYVDFNGNYYKCRGRSSSWQSKASANCEVTQEVFRALSVGAFNKQSGHKISNQALRTRSLMTRARLPVFQPLSPAQVLRAYYSTHSPSMAALNNPTVNALSRWQTQATEFVAPKCSSLSMHSSRTGERSDVLSSASQLLQALQFPRIPVISVVLDALPSFRGAATSGSSDMMSDALLEPGTVAVESAALEFDLTPRLVLPEASVTLTEEVSQGILERINAQIAQLQSIAGDIERVSALGELPVSIERSGTALRVHFPNSDREKVETLMEDQEINSGQVIELVAAADSVSPPMSDIASDWSDDMSNPGLSFSDATITLSSVLSPSQSASSYSLVSNI